MFGLYSNNSNTAHLNLEQSAHALPQLNISDSYFQSLFNDVYNFSLPFDENSFYIQAVDKNVDTFIPYQTCALL